MTYRQVLNHIARTFDPWVARLSASFPNLPRATIEDAVSSVYVQSLSRPTFERAWRSDGTEGLQRLMHTAAWRAVNTSRRTHRRRRQLLNAAPIEGCSTITPESITITRDRARHVVALVPAAANRFGGRNKPDLQKALQACLEGFSDTECARHFNVRRESVNRARHWLRRTTSE